MTRYISALLKIPKSRHTRITGLLITSTCHYGDILPTIAFAFFRAAFGQGIGPVFLYNVSCTGTESSLLSCRQSIGVPSCSHLQDAGVVCPPCKL